MNRSINDFLQDWSCETEATAKIFKILTNDSLNQKITPDGNSMGGLAWHITLCLSEMGTKAGLEFKALSENAPVPTVAEIIALTYQTLSGFFVKALKSQWTDEMLKDKVNMYGQEWTKAEVLDSILKHEIHHRAQITVLMRQAGLKVPGIYGPSREECEAMGMKT